MAGETLHIRLFQHRLQSVAQLLAGDDVELVIAHPLGKRLVGDAVAQCRIGIGQAPKSSANVLRVAASSIANFCSFNRCREPGSMPSGGHVFCAHA